MPPDNSFPDLMAALLSEAWTLIHAQPPSDLFSTER